MKLTILIPPTVSPQAVDFGPQVERSKKGALYLRPNSVTSMTESEWKWIEKHNPSLATLCRVVQPKPRTPVLVAEKKESSAIVEEKVADAEEVPVRRKRKRKKKTRDDG